MEKDEFLKCLSSKLSGEISVADEALLEQAIENNEEFKRLASEFEHYFKQHTVGSSNLEQLNHIWEMILIAEEEGFKEKFNYSLPRKAIFAGLPMLKIAAMLVIFIGASLLGYQFLYRNADPGLVKIVATNQKLFKMLDDGTKIWLNKRSVISYNEDYGKHKREIFLEGEAYFDVTTNKKVPLIIHASKIDIEVKGTAFNVKAYKENKEIQVALVRGLIQVTDKLDSNHKILLKPNEKLIFSATENKAQNNFMVLAMASQVLLGDTKWVADTLVFRKEKLKDLVLRMEKKYDLNIEIQSEQLKEKRFSGTFTNETIHQALAALKLSYPLTYTINKRLVVIKD
ncbi:FecR family protein [Pedobacter insulae]|uniref:FecR protein n=1 Tax=Pedobacter insulae TaxID=414048 RepID=A0A1I2ZQS2_9SPHI|nr:FecR family protein [Pedobacter insulae]SFH40050.1 FecR protein [Pedobacter insulae]